MESMGTLRCQNCQNKQQVPELFCKLELLKYQTLAEEMLPYNANLLTPKAPGSLGGVFTVKNAEMENILKSPLMKSL